MEKSIKKIIIVVLLTIGILLQPLSTLALTIIDEKYSITDQATITQETVDITNVTFVNNNSTITTPTFGLTGIVKNKSVFPQTVIITANFYTENYKLIATNTTEMNLIDDFPTSYSNMLSYDSLEPGYTVNDIKYYSILTQRTTAVITPPINKLHEQAAYSTYPYLIDTYDVKIKVNKNNTYDITETISAYFNEERHGIFRNIPTINTINRLDGSISQNFAKISNVKVNEEFITSQSSDNYQIKIGNANRYITGEKEYKLSYHYNIGRDTSKEFDEVYLNIVGPNWDTAIGYITFEIEMPKDFDPKQIGFSAGKQGSTSTEAIVWEKYANKIIGTYEKPLEPNEALTFRVELEEGYFEISPFLKGLDYLIFFIPLVCLIICVSIWNKYGKDDKPIEVINFYPPQNLNSIDIALLYKGQVEEKDITSLLVYLANKGYIKIEEEKFEKYSYGDFSIRKIKDYDGENECERLFLEGLFNCKKIRKKFPKTMGDRERELALQEDVVTSNDLEYKFHTTIGKISRKINSIRNTKKIFVKGTNKYNWLMILLIFLTYFMMIGVPTYLYSNWTETLVSLFMAAIYSPFLALAVSSKIQKSIRIFLLIFISFHAAMMIVALPLSTALTSNVLYLSSTIFSIICLIGMVICLNNMPKRTPYGNEMYGQIKGFKTFLETAEKDKLEALVEENPNYFYDILPYTYVLGVSRKWINKFEFILLSEPNWYTGTSSFNVTSFGRSLNRTMSSATILSSSSHASSSSGGSGGGSAGGGSGGGGGGSW